MVRVEGFCPACGKETLFLGEGGYVTCSQLGCPVPDAATRVLEDAALRELLVEAVAQDRKVADDPPGLWTPHRQGVRSHIAAIEDEVREAREAWDGEKKPAGEADPARWPLTRAELVQATAAGLRAVRALSPEPSTGVGGSA